LSNGALENGLYVPPVCRIEHRFQQCIYRHGLVFSGEISWVVLLDATKAIAMWITFLTHGLILAAPLSSPIPPLSPCQSSLLGPGWFVGDLNHMRVTHYIEFVLIKVKIPMIGHYFCLDMVPNNDIQTIFKKEKKRKKEI